MKEDYIQALKSVHELVKNAGAPPVSKEDRYKLVVWTENMLYPTGVDPEVREVSELYIAKGITTLDKLQPASDPSE